MGLTRDYLYMIHRAGGGKFHRGSAFGGGVWRRLKKYGKKSGQRDEYEDRQAHRPVGPSESNACIFAHVHLGHNYTVWTFISF